MKRVACLMLFFAFGFSSQPSADDLFASMDNTMKAQKYREALSTAKLLQGKALTPQSLYRLNLTRGLAHYNLWELTNAARYYGEASKISETEEVLYRLGELYYASREYPRARYYFEKLSEKNQSLAYAEYLFYLGKIYLELDERDKAKSALSALALKFPTHQKAQIASRMAAEIK